MVNVSPLSPASVYGARFDARCLPEVRQGELLRLGSEERATTCPPLVFRLDYCHTMSSAATKGSVDPYSFVTVMFYKRMHGNKTQIKSLVY